MDLFCVWTYFVYGLILCMDLFCVWTYFVYGLILCMDLLIYMYFKKYNAQSYSA